MTAKEKDLLEYARCMAFLVDKAIVEGLEGNEEYFRGEYKKALNEVNAYREAVYHA